MKSMENICEILTSDAEGGSNGVPAWAFIVCFKMIAELRHPKIKQVN